MQVPTQYNRLMPYFIVPNANQFIEFMKEVFGATVQHLTPRSEGIIKHGELRIGESVIMFADATERFTSRQAGIFIYVESTDETYKKAIAAGATSIMEPMNQPYGYTCGFHNPFGNDWWQAEA